MAHVQLQDVSKTFRHGRSRGERALSHVNLAIDDGEILILFGSSGCGKTTLLRVVAGLERPDGGTVTIDGRNVALLPPERRQVGFVFTSPALFTRSVFDNIAFGPRTQGLARTLVDARVRDAASAMRIDHLLKRPALTLSRGQQQRVALARAIAAQPSVLLMDEPFSNLDTSLRVELRAELTELARARRLTLLFVTHDGQEAMALGDRIAVMRDGAVLQVDSPKALYESPCDAEVATTIGMPPLTLIAGGNGVRYGIRADAASFAPDGAFEGVVRGIDDYGGTALAYVEGIYGTLLVALPAAAERPVIGSQARVAVDPARVLFFDSLTGKRIISHAAL